MEQERSSHGVIVKEIPVTLENKGQKISAILHTPNNKTDKIVILAHGFTGQKNGPDNIFVKLSEVLANNGIAVFRLDFRGSGESDGEFVDMTITGEVSDLKIAIDYVKNECYSKVGLVGESLGGAVSILGWDERIDCLVLWYPAVYLKETVKGSSWLSSLESATKELMTKGYITVEKRDGRVYNVGMNLVKEWMSANVEKNVPKIKSPLLIITGDNDNDVPYTQSERAMKIANEPKRLVIIPEADHCFRGKNREEWQTQAVKLTSDWFNEWLE